MKTIGLTLKSLRETKKLTLRQLAEMAQIQYSQLSNIENCKRLPSLETIDRLCQALGITVSQVVYMTELEISMSSKRKEVFSILSPYFERIEEVISKISKDDLDDNRGDNNLDNDQEDDNPIIKGGGLQKMNYNF